MRQFIKSDRNKTLRGQQFLKPQDVKKAAAEMKYIIYSVESVSNLGWTISYLK
jgi:hypothetical protein